MSYGRMYGECAYGGSGKCCKKQVCKSKIGIELYSIAQMPWRFYYFMIPPLNFFGLALGKNFLVPMQQRQRQEIF